MELPLPARHVEYFRSLSMKARAITNRNYGPARAARPAPTGSEYVFTASGFHSHAGRPVSYVAQYTYLPEGYAVDAESFRNKENHRR